MPPIDRAERFRMRQRGAGTHKVQTADFGLSFPIAAPRVAPLPQVPSSRSTKSLHATPISGRQPPLQLPNRPTPAAPTSNAQPTSTGRKRGRPPKISASAQDSIPPKRTKVVDERFSRTPTGANEPSSSVRSTRSTRSQGRSPNLVVPASSQSLRRQRSARDRGRSLSVDVTVDQSLVQQMDDGSETGAIVRATRQRIGQRQRNIEEQSGDSSDMVDGVAVDASSKLSERQVTPQKENFTNVSTIQRKSRAGRKTILYTVREDASSEGEDGAGEEEQRSQSRPKKRMQSSTTQQSSPRSKQAAQQVDSTHTHQLQPSRPTTTNKKASAPPSTKRKRPITSPSRRSTRTKSSTVPILVHRLYLSRSGPSSSSMPPKTQSGPTGVNTVDVLSQITREYIHAATTMIQSQETDRQISRRDRMIFKRKREAVEAFGAELDARCFELSEMVDYQQILARRVREGKKALGELEAEWASLRNEREVLGRRMDEARRRHEKRTKTAQERQELEMMVSDVELALQRGRDAEKMHERGGGQGPAEDQERDPAGGLEVRLRMVSGAVSSRAEEGAGGLLHTVKTFNDFLEDALLQLEDRP